MKKLISMGKARWPNLPSWEDGTPPGPDEPWEVDGTAMTLVEPSGMVALAVKGMATGAKPTRILLSRSVESYAERMGLHDLLGVPATAHGQRHPAGNRFTALSVISPRMNPQDCSRLCVQIAGVMGRRDRRLEDLFAYILGELTANVRQNAGRPGVVMAQAWEDGSVEFAIGDWGIGIRQGLAENPSYREITEREALDLAIRPNTSGKDWAGAPGYGTRENSGNGLFTLAFLAREAPGRFIIASGSQSLIIDGTRRLARTLQCPIPGTLASLRFSPGGMDQTSLLLEASKERGLASCQDDLQFE